LSNVLCKKVGGKEKKLKQKKSTNRKVKDFPGVLSNSMEGITNNE